MFSVAVGLAIVHTVAFGSTPQFIPTGHAPGVPVESQMLGLSPNGVFAAGRTFVSGVGSVGTGWTSSTGLFALGQFDGSTIAQSVSNDGTFVGIGGAASSFEQAWRWTQADGFQGLGFLPGTTTSRANDISHDGSVIVGQSGSEAYRWTAGGGMVGLGTAPFMATSSAVAVSADGSVIGGEGNGVGGPINVAWIWSGGTFTNLGHMNPFVGFTRLFGLSSDGTTAVGWSLNANFQIEAFRWTAGSGMVGLGAFDPGAFSYESFATDCSADGSIVVGSSRAPDNHRAFIWTQATGILDLQTYMETTYGLDFGGWTLQEAQAISDDGTVIAGFGYNAAGEREGWVIVIPAPSTAVLLGMGVLAIRRRR
jgi:probable HAF family extracellular repeat protein